LARQNFLVVADATADLFLMTAGQEKQERERKRDARDKIYPLRACPQSPTSSN
jgi:hypothetical protein